MYLENNNCFIDLELADCIDFLKTVPNDYIDLMILDPPFGNDETKFSFRTKKNMDNEHIIPGYIEAPKDISYYDFCKSWLNECYRVLKQNGTCYIINGSTYNLAECMLACKDTGFHLLDHNIWHYKNKVVPTQKKFSTSHYHILRLGKSKSGQTFNIPSDDDVIEQNELVGSPSVPYKCNGKPSTYDRFDVWIIDRDVNHQKEMKNINRLPMELVRKMIRYSSNPGDTVLDCFMGDFTTAYVCIQEGRNVMGCEKNPNTYKYHIDKIGQ